MTRLESDMYLSGDLANLIAALDLAGRGFDGEYGRGWRAACAALAVAVGVREDQPPAVVVMDARATFADGYRQLGPGNLGAFR